MPNCVECQREVPRSEMRGAPDDLRCPACAAKYGQIYEGPRRPSAVETRPWATAVFCAAAVAGSLAYWKLPAVARWLTDEPSAVWSGEIWRLLTTIFPHVNLIHLAFNLYWLWRFGGILESWLGSLRFAGLVVLLAAGSSAASFLTSEYGVGLSGVGFGLFGLLFALRRDKDFAAREIQPGVVQMWVAWFFFCIFTTYTGVLPVANVAHGAGAVLGWLVGQAVLARARLQALAGVVLLVCGLVAATQYMPWNGGYAWHRGIICAENGDDSGALFWLEKAARTHPDGQQLNEYLRWLRLKQKLQEANGAATQDPK